MLFPGLPTLPRRPRVGRFVRLIAVAGGLLVGSAACAQGAEPTMALSADAARAAIAEVLAMPAFWGGWPLVSLLAALAAIVMLVAAAVTGGAMAAKRQAGGQRPADFIALPAPASQASVLLEAQALWPQAPTLAVGRLYQGLLARLATDYHLKVPASDTEAELIERVAALRLSGLEDFTRRLAEHWQQARYAHKAPSDAAWASLCASWRRLFPTDVAP